MVIWSSLFFFWSLSLSRKCMYIIHHSRTQERSSSCERVHLKNVCWPKSGLRKDHLLPLHLCHRYVPVRPPLFKHSLDVYAWPPLTPSKFLNSLGNHCRHLSTIISNILVCLCEWIVWMNCVNHFRRPLTFTYSYINNLTLSLSPGPLHVN